MACTVSNRECKSTDAPSSPLCVWFEFYQTNFSIKTRWCTFRQMPPQERLQGSSWFSYAARWLTRSKVKATVTHSWPCFGQPERQMKRCVKLVVCEGTVRANGACSWNVQACVDEFLWVCLSAHRGNKRCRVTQRVRGTIWGFCLWCLSNHTARSASAGGASLFASKHPHTVPSLPILFNLLRQNFHFFHAACQQIPDS